MQHTIVYFPDYVHANPYQSLLYSGIDAVFHSQSGSIDDARLKLQRQAWDNRVIFHLHWEDAIYRHLPSADEALAECQRFLDQLEGFLDDGGLFLWTVHNRAPHDGRYLEVHRQLCDKLGKLADQIHLHSHAALEELEQRPRARPRADHDRSRTATTGRCSPIRAGSRRRAAGNGRCFLLFGRLGRYKGGAELVQSFAGLPGGPARLLIAGKQIDPIDLSGVPPAVRERITVHDRFVSEDDLLAAFEAADFVVSPYRASLTSGTVLLAMSLARPVIVPRLPTLAELVVDGDNGLLFAPDDPLALQAALERAEADGRGGLAPDGGACLRHRQALRLAGDRPLALGPVLSPDRQAAGAPRAGAGRGLTGRREPYHGELPEDGDPAARSARAAAQHARRGPRGTLRARRARGGGRTAAGRGRAPPAEEPRALPADAPRAVIFVTVFGLSTAALEEVLEVVAREGQGHAGQPGVPHRFARFQAVPRAPAALRVPAGRRPPAALRARSGLADLRAPPLPRCWPRSGGRSR